MKNIFKEGDIVYHFNYGKEKGLVGDVVESTGMIGVSFKGDYDYFHPNHLSFKPYDLISGGLTHKRPLPSINLITNSDIIFNSTLYVSNYNVIYDIEQQRVIEFKDDIYIQYDKKKDTFIKIQLKKENIRIFKKFLLDRNVIKYKIKDVKNINYNNPKHHYILYEGSLYFILNEEDFTSDVYYIDTNNNKIKL